MKIWLVIEDYPYASPMVAGVFSDPDVAADVAKTYGMIVVELELDMVEMKQLPEAASTPNA